MLHNINIIGYIVSKTNIVGNEDNRHIDLITQLQQHIKDRCT